MHKATPTCGILFKSIHAKLTSQLQNRHAVFNFDYATVGSYIPAGKLPGLLCVSCSFSIITSHTCPRYATAGSFIASPKWWCFRRRSGTPRRAQIATAPSGLCGRASWRVEGGKLREVHEDAWQRPLPRVPYWDSPGLQACKTVSSRWPLRDPSVVPPSSLRCPSVLERREDGGTTEV